MNAIKFILRVFFICVLVVIYSFITRDIDLFIWAAGTGDIAGFVLIYLTIKSNKSF